MRKFLIIAFVFSQLLTNAQAPTTGLVAYFPFNGSTANGGSANITASAISTSYTTNIIGTANSAIQFGGNLNSFVDFTDNGNLDFTGTANFSVCFGFFFNGSSTGGLFDNCLNYGGYGVWFWSTVAGTWNLQFNYKGNSVGSAGATAFTINQWHHVAAIRNNGTISLYIDGVFRLSATEGTTVPSYPLNAINGAFSYSSFVPPRYNPFGGKLDEFRVYNRALSASEITATYNDFVSGGSPAVTLSCPSNKTATTAAGTCAAVVNSIDPLLTPSGNFNTVNYTLTGATTGSGNGSVSGMSFNKGVTTVTYSLVNNPSSNCSFTVTVNDNLVPTFTCPANQNINLNANCQLFVPNLIGGLMGSDNCGTVTFSQNPAASAALSSSHNQTHNVVITANDGNGNISQCTVVLTGKNATPPTIVCPNNISTNASPGQCNAIVNYNLPIVTAFCNPAVQPGSVIFSYTGNIVNWTVPAGVNSITILSKGAQGGGGNGVTGGLGASMKGDFVVTPGQVLKILVGGQGIASVNGGEQAGGTGGGGSFIATTSNSPLLVAGGGGGAMSRTGMLVNGGHGQITMNGQAGGSNGGAGGVSGSGGGTWPWTGWHSGTGGGGFNTNGSASSNGHISFGTPNQPGVSFVNNGVIASGGSMGRNGGFGGGGSAGFTGGGGGGYSGGGSGTHDFPITYNGGGGGSYNSGINQTNLSGTNSGNGEVIITYGSEPYTITQTVGLASGSAFPVGTTTNTFLATDGAGNTATCSFTVTVNGGTDTDNDGTPDLCDTDDDNDGIADASDNCPLTANANQLDTDIDGIGNECDPDDDNDGIVDANDNCSLIANTNQLDTDNDGLGNACDVDDDNDGVNDVNDCAPLDATKWQQALLYVDNDNDGYTNGQQTVCYGAIIPTGYKASSLGNDCNDNNNSVWQSTSLYIDNDNDGYTNGQQTVCYGATIPTGYKASSLGNDCNDNNNSVWQSTSLYIDNDNDGYTNGQQTVCYGATIPTGYKASSLGNDCNDNNPAVHPGATEICNGVDDDCNGQVDEMPIVPPVVTSPVIACTGVQTTLNATAQNGGTLSWYTAATGGTFLGNGATLPIIPTSNGSYFVQETIGGINFTVNSLSSTAGAVIEHGSGVSFGGPGTYWDDRGNIAVTNNYVYVTGDGATIRTNHDLTNLVALPIRDAIFTDLSTGFLWSMVGNNNTSQPIGDMFNSNVTAFTGIVKLNETNLNAVGSIINLSNSIPRNANVNFIVAPGPGYLLLVPSGSTIFYRIDIQTGLVSQLTGPAITNFGNDGYFGSESWASYGWSERNANDIYLVYRDANNFSPQRIVKRNIATGVNTILHQYNNLSDMAAITYAPWLNRMYFHHEGTSQFRSGDETLGYLNGTHTLNNGEGNCVSSRTEVIVTISDPEVTITPAGPVDICADGQVTLNAGITQGSGTTASYQWYKNDNILTNATLSSYTATSAGTYKVKFTNTDGCTDFSNEVSVTTSAPPPATITPNGPTTFCPGGSVTLIASAGTSYLWSTGATSSSIVVNSTGNYWVKVYNALGCEATSPTIVVTVEDTEKPNVTKGTIGSCYSSVAAAEAASLEATTYSDNCSSFEELDVNVSTSGTCNAVITVTVTDASNNSRSVAYNTRIDNTAPVLSLTPASVTVNCQSVPVVTTVTASDNCDGAVNVTFTPISTQGSDPAQSNYSNYMITRKWFATDGCGNTVEHVQTITVQDVTAPSLTCPANIVVSNETSLCSAQVTFNAISSDLCSTPIVKYYLYYGTAEQQEISSPWTFGVGSHTVKVVSTDPSGNSNDCTFTVTVNDTEKPAVTKDEIGACYKTVALAEAAALAATTYSDNCTANAQLNVNVATVGTCSAVITVTVTDAANNSSSVTYNTRVDNTSPVLSLTPASVTVNCQSVPVVPTVTATDNCDGNVNVIFTPNSTQGSDPTQGSYYNYTITRKWSATDGCGNTVEHVQTITVQDVTAPSLTCPANIVVSNETGLCSAQVTFSASSSDLCSTPIVKYYLYYGTAEQQEISSPWTFAVGSHTVKVVSTDPSGNSNNCTFDVTVNDTEKPTVTAPTTVDLECSGNLPAPATTITQFLSLADSEADDNCTEQAALLVSSSDGPLVNGNCNGTITRTYTITDAAGNSTTVDHVFTVTDNTKPTATAPATVDLECSSDLPAGKITIAGFLSLTEANANDNCTPQVDLQVSFVDGPLVNGNCNGSITRTYTITDGCGNATTVNHVFTVTDNTKPTTTAPATVDLECSSDLPTGKTTIAGFLSLTWANANDNCTPQVDLLVSFVDGPLVNGNCNGSITRTYTITDGCGNATTVNHLFTVTDNTKPTAAPPTTVDLECSGDLPPAKTTIADFLSLLGANANDNCTPQANLLVSSVDGPLVGSNCNGTITRTYTITDACGNTTTVNHVFTVTDNTIPVINTCPGNGVTFIRNTNAGVCTYQVAGTEFNATGSDNCTGVTMSYSIVNEHNPGTVTGTGSMAGKYLSFGLNTITWIATDGCGNTSVACAVKVDVDKITTTTTLTVNPTSQQYSDLVTLTATVTPNNCTGAGNIGGTVTFKIGSLIIGTAPVINGIATVTDTLIEDMLYDANLNDPMNPTNGPLKPGAKTVTAYFSGTDADYLVTDPTAPLTVTCENADITYNGQTYFSVSPNTNAGTVVLSNYVVDKNDTPTGARGDIRNATATFWQNAINGSVLGTANVPVGLVNPTNKQEGFVTTSFNDVLSNTDISNGGKVYEVWSGLNNYYCENSDTYTPVTLGLPGQDFVTGGGYIVFGNNSAGTYAGTQGKRMNFGFVMKWNSSGKNLQGRVNVVYRKMVNGVQRIYQIKSNAINSLVVENVNDAGLPATGTNIKFRRATISTKANLADITDPLNPISLGGNLNLTLIGWESTTVTTGALDRINVQLSGSGSIGLLFSSNWVSGNTSWQTLNGGKIQVRNPSTPAPGQRTSASEEIITKTSKLHLLIKAFPNPSDNYFNLLVEGNRQEDVVVTVYNVSGVRVHLVKGNANRYYKFGEAWIPGTYFVEVRQGNELKTVKLIKQ